ncbi:MAG: tetratricopeptide repeat protein [Limisphaerales bacterium]
MGQTAKAMDDYAQLRTNKGEETAAALLARAPQLTSNSDAALMLLRADALTSAGKIDEAVELYNQILGSNISLPQASIACQNRGNAYRAKGDDERAFRDYEQAIRFNPANAGAYVNRAIIFDRRGEHEAAIMDYNEAIRFHPKFPQAFFNRGLSYLQQREFDLARRDLTEAIRLDPKFAAAYVNRGGIHIEKKEVDLALADYEAAIRLDPKLAEGYLGRARALSEKRKFARAAADYEKAIKLRPDGPEGLNALAWFRATCPVDSFRNGKNAVSAAMQACELTRWEFFACVDTLAAAFAENKEYQKAADFQMYALTLASLESEHRAGAEKRLALYQQGKPYRETAPEGQPAED